MVVFLDIYISYQIENNKSTLSSYFPSLLSTLISWTTMFSYDLKPAIIGPSSTITNAQSRRKPQAKALIVSITYQGQQSRYWDERARRWGVWDMSLGGDHEAAQAMRDLLMGECERFLGNILVNASSQTDTDMMLKTSPCSRMGVIGTLLRHETTL